MSERSDRGREDQRGDVDVDVDEEGDVDVDVEGTVRVALLGTTLGPAGGGAVAVLVGPVMRVDVMVCGGVP